MVIGFRVLREVLATKPDRLIGWHGIQIADKVWINPYRSYAIARARNEPRERLICELLIGDVVLAALVHPSVQLTTQETKT